MKIAQLAPLTESVPPKLYGGTERVVAYLTDALVELGHDVTLFASGDSETKAKLAAIWPRALRLDPGVRDYFAPLFMELETVARRAHEFDVIHAHLDYFGYPLLRRLGVPSVTTLHGRLDLPELGPLYHLFGDMPVVSISESQRVPLPHAHYIATVLHGLPQGLLQQGAGEGGYLAFLGRISPEKAPDAAIRIAAAAGLPIKMAAKVDKADEQYYRTTVEPLLSTGDIEFIGEIGEHQKGEFLGSAAALLFPIAWREPFGLVLIEAMACGTPVIAFNNGSVPEVLEHGVTGFIVENEQQAVEAVAAIGTLDRGRIRAEFERRFTAHHMAQNYLKIYASLAKSQRTGRRVFSELAMNGQIPLGGGGSGTPAMRLNGVNCESPVNGGSGIPGVPLNGESPQNGGGGIPGMPLNGERPRNAGGGIPGAFLNGESLQNGGGGIPGMLLNGESPLNGGGGIPGMPFQGESPLDGGGGIPRMPLNGVNCEIPLNGGGGIASTGGIAVFRDIALNMGIAMNRDMGLNGESPLNAPENGELKQNADLS